MLTLKKNNEFQNVFLKGKWYSSKYLVIYVVKNSDNFNKVGIAVGKKVAKSVKRNRIRRVIREAYRLNENNIMQGNDIVIVWRNKIEEKDVKLDIIQSDLLKCLKKAEILLF